MIQCSNTILNVTPGQVLDGSQLAQNGTPAYTVTSATPGILNVVNGDLEIANNAPPGNYTRNVTIQDSTGESVTCPIEFRVRNNQGGANCTGAIIPGTDGSVSPGQVVTGATAYTSVLSDIVHAQTGNIQVTSVSPTSIDFICTGPGVATITPTMANGSTACTVEIDCDGSTSGECRSLTIPGSDGVVTPGQIVSGATSFTSVLDDIVAGQTGNIQITSVSPTQISFTCTGGGTATITPEMADGSTDCSITIDCDDDGNTGGCPQNCFAGGTVACGSTLTRTFNLGTTVAPTISFLGSGGSASGLTMTSSGVWQYTFTPTTPCSAASVTEVIEWDNGQGGTCTCNATISITDGTDPTGECGLEYEETTTAGVYRITNNGTTNATNTATGQVIPPGGSITVSVPAGGGQQCFTFECEC